MDDELRLVPVLVLALERHGRRQRPAVVRRRIVSVLGLARGHHPCLDRAEEGVRPALDRETLVSWALLPLCERNATHQGEVVVVLRVEREAERGAAGHTRGLVVLVAAGEDELVELPEAAGRVPVLARVEVGIEEEDVELRLVLERTLNPPVLVLQLLRGRRDELLGDL